MRRTNAAPSLLTPKVGRDGDPVTITYGHNTGVRKMTMIFSAQVCQIILTPEEAEDMAKQLQFYAACARGEKPS